MNALLQQLYVARRDCLKKVYEKHGKVLLDPEKHYRFRIHPDTLRVLRNVKYDEIVSIGLFNYPAPCLFGFTFIEDRSVNKFALEEISCP